MSDDNKGIKISPIDYIESTFLAQEVGQDLLARLQWMALKPKRILVLSCGSGEESRYLQAAYPIAQVLALDVRENLLDYARRISVNPSPIYLCAPAEKLPIRSDSIDLIVAHFLLPWQSDWDAVFHEWRRVLVPEGLVLFSALGTETLSALSQHIPLRALMADMHDLGDHLLRVGFNDVVLDVDYFTVNYRSPIKMLKELYHAGFIAEVAIDSLHSLSLPLSTNYEVIYAHGFSPQSRQTRDSDGNVRVPLSALRRGR